MMKRIIITILCLLIILPISFILSSISVSAICTVTLDQTAYTEGVLATATKICSSPNEQSQAYTSIWTNSSGHVVKTFSDTTPPVKNTFFFDTFTINSTYVESFGNNLTITLTGTNLEGTDSASVTTASSSDLVISSIVLRSEYFIDKFGALSFDVEDDNGDLISNALLGEWNVDVKLFTIVQSVREGMDSFEVVERLSLFDRIKNKIPLRVGASIFPLAIITSFLFLVLLVRRREKEPKN